MANEITVIVGLSGAKGGMNIASGTRSRQITMGGANMVAQNLTANGNGSNGTVLPLASLANCGSLLVVNQSLVDAAQIGSVANISEVISDIAPNSSILIQPGSGTNTIYGRGANANTVSLACYGVEL